MRESCSCISAPLFHLSCHCTQLPSHQAPSSLGLSTIVKLLPLCPTKIYCTACISSYAVQCSTASAPMVGYPRSRELIEAENPLHPSTLHPLASTCSSAALLAHLLFQHLHLFNLLCSTHLRPRWVVCHQQTLQHTENLAMRTEYNNIFVAMIRRY